MSHIFLHLVFLILCGCIVPANISNAQEISPITIALTEDIIEVDAGFSGASITLFGVITDSKTKEIDTKKVDLVATITGPPRIIEARRIERNGPIWIPGEASTAENVPGLYFVLSTRAIDLVTNEATRRTRHLGIKTLPVDLKTAENSTPMDASMRDAVLASGQRQGLFRTFTGTINMLENGLFAVEVDLPAKTPVGDYTINVSAWFDEQLIGEDHAGLSVSKAGLGRQIYDLAYDQPFFYGIMCVLISLFAGWAVSIAFHKP